MKVFEALKRVSMSCLYPPVDMHRFDQMTFLNRLPKTVMRQSILVQARLEFDPMQVEELGALTDYKFTTPRQTIDLL